MYAQPLALGLRPSAHPLLQLRRGWWPRAGSCGLATSARVGQLAAATTVVASSSSSSGPSNVNASAQRPRTWRDFGHPSRRATDVLLVVTCLLYAAQTLLPGLLLLGAKVRARLLCWKTSSNQPLCHVDSEARLHLNNPVKRTARSAQRVPPPPRPLLSRSRPLSLSLTPAFTNYPFACLLCPSIQSGQPAHHTRPVVASGHTCVPAQQPHTSRRQPGVA